MLSIFDEAVWGWTVKANGPFYDKRDLLPPDSTDRKPRETSFKMTLDAIKRSQMQRSVELNYRARFQGVERQGASWREIVRNA